MKFSHLKFLFILGALAFFVSCGDDDSKKKDDDDDTEEPAEYYIQFKMNGVLKTFEDNNPGYQSCGNCACASVPFSTAGADLEVCIDNEFGELPIEEVEGFEGSTVDFSEGDFPYATFSFWLDGVRYSTFEASSQTGSTLSMTEVSEDGEYVYTSNTTYQMFKVKGTFSCTVRAEDGETDIAITEGKFLVRFNESY